MIAPRVRDPHVSEVPIHPEPHSSKEYCSLQFSSKNVLLPDEGRRTFLKSPSFSYACARRTKPVATWQLLGPWGRAQWAIALSKNDNADCGFPVSQRKPSLDNVD